MRLANERAELVRFAQRLRPEGLVVGTSGNLSVRVGDLVAATPSGLDYDVLTPELICVTDLDGRQLEGELDPTSEMPLHLSVYNTTDHTSVVHTHATAAAVASTLVDELPVVHYLTALFGGPVRVAPYATYGTPELAASVTEALKGRTGCLMSNHGTVTVGDSLAKAYQLNQYLEWLCEVWLRAVGAGAALGVSPRELPGDELDRVIEKFGSYGQVPPPGVSGAGGSEGEAGAGR
ncbi:class II aldolase/adducin family protein [Actinopolymorpha singaporensis]|uniref:L-fuculose 1-phosphate aldolase n=1 Tax=Actinopolymorpha singaporensis TaxID=117157 RepID=A0A1H1YG87_9ACTN|nr:class II aldolase/adducin family protein [Actinopolymorpha singaporensis]SDT20453.1 L-fuculose 1-phosphate aldolase [Actinopolymorpha singaporensis]